MTSLIAAVLLDGSQQVTDYTFQMHEAVALFDLGNTNNAHFIV
jgi:hypothetical protein